jgi:O-acetyl-ADP-ribose deacetylase (regulator of RNase III)/uncharacterized protein YwgA
MSKDSKVKVSKGNLFESKAQTLVNTVNCEGIMGKGIALEFKKRFPEMFQDYMKRCERGEVKLGQPYLYRHKELFQPWIINFPTKDTWRSVTKLSDIIAGLEYLLKNYKNWGITSIAVPPLGCGLGQLEWQVVGPTLYRYLERMDILVELYAPYDTPYEELQPDFLEESSIPVEIVNSSKNNNWIKPAWIALVEILNQIESQPFHWPVGRTIFQKIAYVATEEGLPTDINFEKGSYGPFSKELKKLESRLVNNGLISVNKQGKMLEIKVGKTLSDARKAYDKDLKQWENIINKVVDLFMRVDTRHAEVVATVIYAARSLHHNDLPKPTEMDVLEYIREWKIRRKPQFKDEEVGLTIRSLATFGWIDVLASDDLPVPEEEFIGV